MLSAVLLSPALLDDVREHLEPADFYAMQHRCVFEAMIAIEAAGVALDVLTLANELKAKNRLQQVGGTPFLAQLSDATPSVANVIEHARMVRRFAALRRAGQALRALAAESSLPETRGDVEGFLQRCEAEVFAFNGKATARDTASTMHELIATAATELDPSKPREARGISTGLVDLDELSLGFIPGEVWYLAARPGMGKTALALGMAASVAKSGRHAVFFSLEMTRRELRDRIISADAEVPYRALHKRELSHSQWGQVVASFHQLAQLPLMLDDDGLLTPSRLRSRTRRHATKLRVSHPGKLGLVVVDYVQLMEDDPRGGRGSNRNDELEHISRSLKLLAREMGVTVLALAQLNREQKNRADKRPLLTDLRGSGAFEQDADKVLFIHRDEVEGEERGEAELILAKGRNAGTGKTIVRWQPWCMRFRDSERRQQAGFDWQGLMDDEGEPPPMSDYE